MRIDIEQLNTFLETKYKNKTVMAKELDISRSHLDKVFDGKAIGNKVLESLRIACIEKEFDFNSLWMNPPIILSNKKVESINILDKDMNVLASISSEDVITREDIDVVFHELS